MENKIQKGEHGTIVVDGQNVSFAILQSIYNEFTGKQEKIFARQNYIFDLNIQHIRDLISRLDQNIETYDVKVKNLFITVNFEGQEAQKYSSLEKFESQVPSSSKAIEGIIIDYSFMLQIKGDEKPRNYSVGVGVYSDVTMIKKYR